MIGTLIGCVFNGTMGVLCAVLMTCHVLSELQSSMTMISRSAQVWRWMLVSAKGKAVAQLYAGTITDNVQARD
jgi:hypothetical protein